MIYFNVQVIPDLANISFKLAVVFISYVPLIL